MSTELLDGGTTATTGGTTQTFDRTSTQVNNGYDYADVSESNHLLREHVQITSRAPALQVDGTYSKFKAKVQFIRPIQLADGTISYCIARAEIEYHPEATSTDVDELREMGGQCFIGNQFDDLFVAGTLPA